MEIDINQKKISIGDKYQIFTDGQPTHAACRRLFNLLPLIHLFKIGNDRPQMTIQKRWSFLKAKYDLTLWDNNVVHFRTVSFWKRHYECQCGFDQYDIYGHRGRKFSIYKNDVQVAWWNKEAVTWFAGDNYKITANNDCDKGLLISFCLVIDNFSSDDHDGNALNYNFGNIGPQAKKFDDNWLPKI